MTSTSGRPRPSEITPEGIWLRRRSLIAAAGLAAAGVRPGQATAAAVEQPTPQELVTRHNNYYEFGPEKSVVWKLAEDFRSAPWSITVEGECERPRTWGLEELLRRFGQEDRIYRLRCVEGWSAVVPWRGFALGALLAESRPLSTARHVEFISVLRPEQMIGQRRPVLDWPYREALRIDEAMHPLVLLATGMYGRKMPTQCGAPLRLAVPWKYGFKSAKAITRIRLVQAPPTTSWNTAAPSEYGYFGNVNPGVAHPRWSQRREQRLGEMGKRDTLLFNGYAQEVAHLYAGMDPIRQF